MPAEIDKPKSDSTHRKAVKNKKIEKKKKIEEANNNIDCILRSPAYTEAEKERHLQQRERNLKDIKKLNDEINKIDNELFSPTGNNPVTRGRSQTRGRNIRNASPSPIKRSPRSASSSVPRRRSDQTDEDELRKMQDLLEQSRKENELLRGEWYAESLGYGEEMNQFRSKSQEMDSDVSYRLRVQNADLSIHHKKLYKENIHLRDMNYKFCLDSELMSKDIKELATKLQNQNIEVTRYKLDCAELEHDNDLLRNENERFKIERKSLYEQIEDLSRRSRQKEAEFEETLRAYEVENEKLRNENSETMEQYQSLRIFFSERRDYYNKIAEKAVENNVILHERLQIEVEEKERIQRDNITLKTQIDSSSRENEWNRKNNLEKLGKLQKENDRLKENLELKQKAYQRECGNVTILQQKETEMRQKISEIIRRNQNLENEMKEEKDSILTKREREIEIIRLNSVVRDKDLVEAELRNKIEDLEKKNNEIQSRTEKWLLRIEQKGREQLKQDSDKELNRLRQLEINYKIEKENLESNHTDLEKKVKQLQDEKERLLQNEKSERKIADKLKRELDAEKRDSNKLRERMRDLERESIEKIETGRKQVLDEKDRELIRLRRSENDYKNKTDTLKHELADLRRDFALLQEEKDELIESEKTEMKKAKGVQKELDDARREEVKFRDRIKELERHMTVPKVDPSMSAENSRLKEDLKHLGIALKNAQERIAENGESVRHYMKQVEALQREKRQAIAEKESALARLTQLEINNKIEAASRNSNQTALEKKVKRLQDEKDRLLQNEEMKRKVAEKIKSELGDRDLERERFQQKEKLGTERKQESVEKERELIRLRGLESIYKNETDTLKHELADLKKKNELLQEEKEELVESEETERKIAETVQNELDDAKRETLMLQDRIKELQRQMKSFPKVDPSMAEENSRLKEDHKHLGIELQKAQQKITENEESVRHYMRQVETLQREKQQAIAEKESALTRLSALAGDRLRDNNAAIADLSDENRPINLGEKFSELYDNQWTDAIEKLEKLMTERDAIQKLLSMIQDIYCVCEDIAKKQLDLIAKEFGLEGRKEKLKRLKDFRKSMAPDNLQDIKERVNSSCVAKDFSEEAAYCASYINRSVELCWYMCIQDPPVVLEFKASHGDVFNDKIYRHFTKSGRTIDYMVWPVMYLHSNGPLLQKGVVQPV